MLEDIDRLVKSFNSHINVEYNMEDDEYWINIKTKRKLSLRRTLDIILKGSGINMFDERHYEKRSTYEFIYGKSLYVVIITKEKE